MLFLIEFRKEKFYGEKGLMVLLRGTEKFILWLVTVGLVFLITIQMLISTNGSPNYLQWVQRRLGQLANPSDVREATVLEKDELVTVKLVSGGYYPEVRVLVNGDRAYNFRASTVQVPVNHGDFLIIDARGINEGLLFQITSTSEGIMEPAAGRRFIVQNDVKAIPVTVRAEGKF